MVHIKKKKRKEKQNKILKKNQSLVSHLYSFHNEFSFSLQCSLFH